MRTFIKNHAGLKIAVTLLAVFILTACSSSTPVIQTVEVTRLVPQVLVATVIIRETVLPTPNEAVPATATHTQQTPLETPVPTATATPPVGVFRDAQIGGFGYRSDGEFFITVDTSQELSGDYKAIVGKIEFTCDLVPKYPKRIYCYGPLVQYGKIIGFRIFTDDEARATVFETEFMAPLKSTVTPTPTSTPTRTETPEE